MTEHDTAQIVADLDTHRPVGYDPDVCWIVVAPGYPSDKDTVQRYIYEGSAHLIATTNEGAGDVCLVLVHGRPGRSDAASQAQYQAGRFQSGLMQAVVCETFAGAYSEAIDMLARVMEIAERRVDGR